jgi:hypothetical protein
VHGSSIADGRIQIDGGNVAVPQKQGGHDNMYVIDTINAQEVVVSAAGGLGEAATAGVMVNVIPREGGNRYSGQYFVTGSSGALQASNFNDDLKKRGLVAGNTVEKLWDTSVGFGGPLKKDKLWFFWTGRSNGYRNLVAGMYVNKNANNPKAYTYDPDFTHQAITDGTWWMTSGRITWQATPRNKFTAFWDEQHQCKTCIGGGTATSTIEATGRGLAWPSRVFQGNWKSPVTSKLLAEAGMSTTPLRWGAQPRDEDPFKGNAAAGPIRITEQAGLIPGLSYGSVTFGSNSSIGVHTTAALTYVTGAHSAKFGMLRDWGTPHGYGWNYQNLNYRFRNGIPNQLTEFAFPLETQEFYNSFGLFAQDTWHFGRTTLMGGVRFDQSNTDFAKINYGPTQYGPTIVFPEEKGARFKDISPRAGAAYDLFGNGKTALKASLGKYMIAQDGQASLFGRPMSHIGRVATSTSRTWTDSNGNYVPDCDLRSPAANGECGAMANRLFGTDQVQTNYDPAITHGWGVRPYNWEFSGSIQQELLPRIALTATYFRRWFGNFIVTDNLAVTPADFDRFSLTVNDPRLPGGSVTLNDLYDVTPAKFGLVDNLVTSAKKFGDYIQRYDGLDLTIAARSKGGLTVQGGTSIGRNLVDVCDIVSKVDSPSAPRNDLSISAGTPLNNAAALLSPSYCKTSESVRQGKFLASYSAPGGVQVSATLQSLPGVAVIANYNVPNAIVASSLGRPLAGGAANATVNLVKPFSQRGDRINQLDLRLAKVFNFGGKRLQGSVDLFNALNSSAVQTENTTFDPAGGYRVPTLILDARLIKFTAQVNF